ncbi:MAG: phosphatase PAP2 family protein [bacterium]|nr:phosphatase PAP2 family protein [bacterium]
MDLFIFQQINQLALRWLWLDTLAIFFAQYFEYILILCLLLFLLKNFKKYWPMIIQAFGAAILARLFIVNFIRWLWPRPRPFVENNVNLLLSHNTASFPSGHAALYFAISTVVYRYNKKAGIGFFLASFLISISRVFCGIHWPSDILAGAVIGILSGYVITLFFQRFFLTSSKQPPQ